MTTTHDITESTELLSSAMTEGRIIHAGGDGDNVRSTWRYSRDAIVTNTRHCSKCGVDALLSAFHFCIDPAHGVRFEAFCDRVGYDKTSVDQMFRGRYKGTGENALDVPANFIKKTKEFVRLEGERTLGGATDFVLTPTVHRVWRACDLARESQTPVFLWGPSHIGKTWALERYTRDNNHGHTVYCRMEAASGLKGMVRNLARSLGISDKANHASLVKSIQNALRPDLVVIIDELHLLMYTYRREGFFACVELLRQFYDLGKCGFVLCGTELMLKKIREGESGGELLQILRRGIHRCNLPNGPTAKDVAAILSHSGLDLMAAPAHVKVEGITEEPYKVLKQLAARNGLKAITERLRYARKLALKARKPLTWEHLMRAHLIIEAESADDTTGGGW